MIIIRLGSVEVVANGDGNMTIKTTYELPSYPGEQVDSVIVSDRIKENTQPCTSFVVVHYSWNGFITY